MEWKTYGNKTDEHSYTYIQAGGVDNLLYIYSAWRSVQRVRTLCTVAVPREVRQFKEYYLLYLVHTHSYIYRQAVLTIG
jgi:hypothetical protein